MHLYFLYMKAASKDDYCRGTNHFDSASDPLRIVRRNMEGRIGGKKK